MCIRDRPLLLLLLLEPTLQVRSLPPSAQPQGRSRCAHAQRLASRPQPPPSQTSSACSRPSPTTDLLSALCASARMGAGADKGPVCGVSGLDSRAHRFHALDPLMLCLELTSVCCAVQRAIEK
eukprot:287827-Rhodomonas_salina.1